MYIERLGMREVGRRWKRKKRGKNPYHSCRIIKGQRRDIQNQPFWENQVKDGALKIVARTQVCFTRKGKRRLLSPLELEIAAMRREKKAGVVCRQTSDLPLQSSSAQGSNGSSWGLFVAWDGEVEYVTFSKTLWLAKLFISLFDDKCYVKVTGCLLTIPSQLLLTL